MTSRAEHPGDASGDGGDDGGGDGITPVPAAVPGGDGGGAGDGIKGGGGGLPNDIPAAIEQVEGERKRVKELEPPPKPLQGRAPPHSPQLQHRVMVKSVLDLG